MSNFGLTEKDVSAIKLFGLIFVAMAINFEIGLAYFWVVVISSLLLSAKNYLQNLKRKKKDDKEK